MRTTYKYDAKTGLMVPSAPQPAGTCNMLMVNQLAGFGAGGGAPYVANAVTFDGNNDYLTRGADLSGNSDGKKFTCNFWLKRNSTGSTQVIYVGDNNEGVLFFNNNELHINFDDTGGTEIVDIFTSSITTTTDWVNISTSFDLSSTSKRHLLVDGSSDLSVNTYSDQVIDFTQPDHFVGAASNLGMKIDGDIADLSIFIGTYTDLSAANPFRDADGKPADPGSDGSGYGLGTPIVMLTGPTADWHTNKGSGGGFTENGALTTASTSPSD